MNHDPTRLDRALRRAILALVLPTGMGYAHAAEGVDGQSTGQLAADARDVVELATVTVSAERREGDLQKTPASVTVLDGEQLRRENRLTIAEIVAGAPGVQVQDGAEGPTFIVRGTSNNLSPNTDSPNAIYVDGVYTDRGDISRAAFYDLDRVEILRGPQGTLWGANAVGGAINIVSNDPETGVRSGLLKLGVGNYGDRRSEGVLNLPTGDVSALRLAFATQRRDGYMSTGQQDADIASARLKFAWRAGEVFSMVLGAQFNRLGGNGPGAAYTPYPVSVEDLGNPWYSGLPADSEKNVRTTLLNGELRWDFGRVRMVWQPTWYDDHFDADASYSGERQLQQYDKRQTTQELRLESAADSRLQWVAGLHYLRSNAPQSILVMEQPINAWTYTRYQSSESWAGFGQATWPLRDGLRLTAGLRHSRDDRSLLQVDVPYDDSQPSSIVNSGTPFAATFTKTTWKAGIERDLGADSLLYASVSTGFRAGGFYADAPYDPETVTAYAVGSKNRFLGNRLQLNAEAFLNRFDGYQLSFFDPATWTSGVFTAENVEVRGAELEARWLATAHDQFDVSLAWLDTEVGRQTGSIPATVTLEEGQPLNHAPRWSWNLGYQRIWDFARGDSLTASVKLHYQTESWVYYTRRNGSLQDAYHQTDVYLTYDNPGATWSLTGYVTNIEDVPVITTFSPAAGGIIQLAPPRMYGVQVTWRF